MTNDPFHFEMASWNGAKVVRMILGHPGAGNRETWARIIACSAYCDENDNDDNNINKPPLSPVSLGVLLNVKWPRLMWHFNIRADMRFGYENEEWGRGSRKRLEKTD